MTDYRKKFAVKPGQRIRLAEISADVSGKIKHETDARAKVAAHCERIRKLQELMFAERKRSLLIVLQAMDTGGKDGTIDHVFAALNPQGAYVHAFKKPSDEEAAHDFLWRAHRAAPERGQVAIFNRSHYEDVLVVRVHDLVPKNVWSKRYALINDFEKMLAKSGTHILKFYLHITPDEQLRRFEARLENPEKQWKISEADYTERAKWDDYIAAYEDAIAECSTERAPWYVIPANHKWFRNLAVSHIVVDTLEELHMNYPEPTVDIEEIRRTYHALSARGHERA